MLVIAITISAIAAWYSVAGLTAIFAAAVVPVIIMGGALEAGKIVATVWLHNNWQRAGWLYKTYLVPAIVFLMLLTSMGIFGFLSKAHSDQSLVSGDAMSKIAIYDEKIAAERDNIAAAKKALEQMNSQVDQMMGRTDTDRGAERSVSIRRSQAKERNALQADITKSQKNIQALQQEAAPLRAEFRKVEAEVGPIKYIAAFIYGDNPDTNVLERAVRWVIILIVIVFDPLALCLILAANKQLEWAREGTGGWVHEEKDDEDPPEGLIKLFQRTNPKYEKDDGPVTAEQVEQIKDSAAGFFTRAQFVAKGLDSDDEKNRAAEANAKLAEIEKPEPDLDIPVLENEEMWAQRVIDEHKEEENFKWPFPAAKTPESIEVTAEEEAAFEEMSSDIAELQQPATTDIKPVTDFEAIVETVTETKVDAEPPKVDEYNTPIRRGADYAVRYKGKVYNLDAFNSLHPGLAIQADNETLENASQCGFGDKFPDNPLKGDMFIRTDYLPERLFKWNSAKWIEVDKNTTDSYTYNQAYIQHLIGKLEAGEYEIEDLSDAEQSQVEQQIEEILKNNRA
jgi:hypothetical protein